MEEEAKGWYQNQGFDSILIQPPMSSLKRTRSPQGEAFLSAGFVLAACKTTSAE